ncbi:MAG: hypothetical protein HC839_05410, partial [Leptolyngbyaceae cyanobacterium RM2_2_21]|nr:hypothetical protein [Leptolyngbyaceae cyanobacterium RM2_2_21]
DDVVSATPAAFIYPLLLAFLYYLLRRSRLPCLLSIFSNGAVLSTGGTSHSRYFAAAAAGVERRAITVAQGKSWDLRLGARDGCFGAAAVPAGTVSLRPGADTGSGKSNACSG